MRVKASVVSLKEKSVLFAVTAVLPFTQTNIQFFSLSPPCCPSHKPTFSSFRGHRRVALHTNQHSVLLAVTAVLPFTQTNIQFFSLSPLCCSSHKPAFISFRCHHLVALHTNTVGTDRYKINKFSTFPFP